jgi:hypothetical protein
MKFMNRILFTLTSLTVITVNAQIPNSGFENWITKRVFGIEVTDPEGWHTSNLSLRSEGKAPAVTQTTDAVSGKAMKIVNIDNDNFEVGNASTLQFVGTDIIDKFPINLKPYALKGYYKYSYTQKDTFNITVLLFKNGDNIGYGVYKSDSSTASYVPFELEINYYGTDTAAYPDSAMIAIACSEYKDTYINLGVELYIDELTFDGIATSVFEKSKQTANAAVYPNPVHNRAQIKFEQEEFGYAQVAVYDVLGKKVEDLYHKSHNSVGSYDIDWDTDHLDSGVYFVKVTAANRTKTIRVVID